MLIRCLEIAISFQGADQTESMEMDPRVGVLDGCLVGLFEVKDHASFTRGDAGVSVETATSKLTKKY